MQQKIRAGFFALSCLAFAILGQQLFARQEVEGESKEPHLEVIERAILAPADGVDRAAWLDAMRRWREAERERTKYDGSAYEQAGTQWTKRNFYQTLMLVEDRYFYDPFADKYTVDRYLDDLESRFGGIDSIILWAVYPNIGIDNRNQNDHLHDLPGGLDAVKNVVADFHRRGVRVVLPIMPWDTGTRAKSAPGWKMLLNDIRRIDADGVFGDTMIGMSEELQNAMNESGRMLALQPEVEAPDCAFAAGNIISWGSWPFQVPKPSVGKYKWFEPRHQINLCHRWETDRTDQLVTALRAPQIRGRWGEIQLERVVELGGMVRHCDFDTQVTARFNGQLVRPDLVVHLAGGRNIIVDAKVPFSSYLYALDSDDPEENAAYLRRHAHLLRTHITQLSAKGYIDAFDPTPEFVVLFVPADPFLDAALGVDPEILEYAFSRNIVIATPTTLFALLRTVALGWRQEDISDKARDIQRLGRELYTRLNTMGDHYQRVGRHLEKTIEAYNATLGSLDSRVMVTARRLADLDVPARTDRPPLELRPVTDRPRHPREDTG